MCAESSAEPMTEARLHARIALDQIEALFSAVTVSVCGGAIAAGVLVATLHWLEAVNPLTGTIWACWIALCALLHILLCRGYRQAAPVQGWQPWAMWFTVICLAEGIGWGWASLWLVSGAHAGVLHLVFLIAGGVAAASIPVFSPYLPAFFAFFIPTTFGAIAASLLSRDPVQLAAFPAMLVFLGAMGAVGVRANRSFSNNVRLRIRTEFLAEDLLRQKEIAEQASLAKSTFLAAASHDLRQPVHALGLFVGALRGVNMPGEGQVLLEQIEASVQAMGGLFNALLDISQLDAGIVEVTQRNFAVGPLLDRVCREHASEAKVKGLGLAAKACSLIVYSDPVLLERILRNLVSNAVRYTDQGRIVIGCRRRNGAVAIQVWDTGRGIAADQQERVFQEYYQLANPERDRAKGLGLGLAIVRRLTDLLDCRMQLCSEPGRGSCFEVTMPLASGPSTASLIPLEAETENLGNVLVAGFLVVIDDERAIRDAMSSLLREWGHEVVAAESGDEIMRRLTDHPMRPDLIICDYRLRNGEHGIEVIERLRAEYNETIPAMLITGDTAPDRLTEAQASGLLLLHKPVSNGRLRAAAIRLMASAKR